MINRYLARAIFLLAVTAPSQAQLLGHDVLQIDNMDLFTLPIEGPEFELEPPIQNNIKTVVPQYVTGADALLDEIPDANELVTSLSKIEVVDKTNTPVLTEVHVQHGWRALQQEWLLLLTADQMVQLRSFPISVISENDLPQLQMFTARIRVSDRDDNINTLQTLLAPLGAEILERHHVYDVQAAKAQLKYAPEQTREAKAAIDNDQHEALSIGIIDTAIDLKHISFVHTNIQIKSFVEPAMPQIGRAHV